MKSLNDLRQHLARIDRRGYKAYKDIQGEYDGEWFSLYIDHVQGDPFAAPSKIRVRVNHEVSQIPIDLSKTRVRAVALRDFLTRGIHKSIQRVAQGNRGIGKSGLISIDVGGQEILERTSVVLTDQWVETRLEVGLPAAGRTILGKQAQAMLCQEIPSIIQQGLLWSRIPPQLCQAHVDYAENYETIRQQLSSRELVAFVADGAILPRASGATTRPLSKGQAKPFKSPESLRVTFDLPHPVSQSGSAGRSIVGLGIPQGISLIVGGGYHGKSTLLQAIQHGVYPHIPGDGREYVVTAPDAVKVRAEDGRRIQGVDISGFITNLPQQQSTTCFSTDNASGSTSQAATILEALEIGSRVILMDEDTSATNFLIRDARMQALVNKNHEPITPLLDRIRELDERFGVSTVLVMGGCGDYFDVADTVILMKNFQPVDVTTQAKDITRTHPMARQTEVAFTFPPLSVRIPLADSMNPSRGRKDVKISVRDVDELVYGVETINLQAIEQLMETSQTHAVGFAIYAMSQRFMDGETPLQKLVSDVEALLNREGLDCLSPFIRQGQHPGNFSRPRTYEIAAALNRLRTLCVRQCL